MTTELAPMNGALALSEAVEQALINGDLGKLDARGRVELYHAKCRSLGLNPLTNPFLYVNLNGKLVLYATKDCAEQLRKLHGISLSIASAQRIEDVYIVRARAVDRQGRHDESTGVVTIGNLKGDGLANALMKAETKSKRRVTLSICGLGTLDETEIETIRGAEPVEFHDDRPMLEAASRIVEARIEQADVIDTDAAVEDAVEDTDRLGLKPVLAELKGLKQGQTAEYKTIRATLDNVKQNMTEKEQETVRAALETALSIVKGE
jgi:hypothetical protein